MTTKAKIGMGVAGFLVIAYIMGGADEPAPAPAAPAQGGVISDLASAANQLGVGQAVDLLKGVVVPGITQAIQNAGAAAAAPPVLPPPPAPAG